MGKLIYNLLKIILLLVLPFILLVRGSVFFHEHYELYSWFSLLGGMGITVVVLFVYMTFFYGKLTGKVGKSSVLLRRTFLAFLLVLGYCVYGLIFISGSNTKHEEVRNEYTQLHPILRLGVSTIVFLDKSLIVTDASRVTEDYKKMGLPALKNSLHYQQKDGFVHAVDIRTNGRSEYRNFFIKSYFWLMGFNTLRHVGTGDHLHISLSSHDAPGAI